MKLSEVMTKQQHDMLISTTEEHLRVINKRINLPDRITSPMDIMKLSEQIIPLVIASNRIISSYVEFVKLEQKAIVGLSPLIKAQTEMENTIREIYKIAKNEVPFLEEKAPEFSTGGWQRDYQFYHRGITDIGNRFNETTKQLKSVKFNSNLEKFKINLQKKMSNLAEASHKAADAIREYVLMGRRSQRQKTEIK
ncbi:MAG: hypothetical protein WC284_14725 [Candidimonas sp.]